MFAPETELLRSVLSRSHDNPAEMRKARPLVVGPIRPLFDPEVMRVVSRGDLKLDSRALLDGSLRN